MAESTLRLEEKVESVTERTTSFWGDAARRFRRNRLAVTGLIIVLAIILLAAGANILAPQGYNTFNGLLAYHFPSWEHLFGTDDRGRDELAIVLFGARTALLVGFSTAISSIIIGVPLGLLSGLRGGALDFVVMRVVDITAAFPQVLFALFIVAAIGSGLLNVILAIGLLNWVILCRLVRAQVLALRSTEYVEAARAMGASEGSIMWRHLLPNTIGPLLVAVAIGIPSAIFTEAGLGFLGLGIDPTTPDWGNMIANARENISYYWHLALFPALALSVTMLAFNFVGDGLRDALDPRDRR
ncbi:MAG TPA: ABC transporter permease [Chloroflexota bacterium]|nr:ABC transporter permease [Chloroflexota bacterium]